MIAQEQEQTRAAWDKIAAGYDEFVTATGMPVGEDALRLGAHVLAADLSPKMIERLKARACDEGLSNLEARVMDGHALELEDNTFDISASQFGVMLFPDLPRGLSELARVTRPGGRVLMVTFGPPSNIEFIGFFVGAIKAAVPGFTGLPVDPPPLPFQVSDPEVLRQRFAEAGLKDIRVETVTEKMEFQSGNEMYDSVTNSNPVGAMLVADLTEDQKATVRQVLDDMLRERSGGSGPAILTHPVNIGVGTK